MTRLKQIYELYRRVHALNGNASIAGLVQIAHMSAALEALLKELYEKPKNINSSTLRTVAAGVDFLGFLFERGNAAGKAGTSRRQHSGRGRRSHFAPRHRLRAGKSPAQIRQRRRRRRPPCKLLAENHFDLVFLDVDMPGMTGFELCTKLRALPLHKKTPVVFVTSLSDFDSRTSSTMAGGNDFIAKPFLFIELTVKALIHVLRGKLQPVKSLVGTRS